MSSRKGQVSPGPPIARSVTVTALLAEVTAALSTLESLQQHQEKLGAEIVRSILEVVQDSRRRLTRVDLYVCIVGEKKVGKSTFLNALLGNRVLGVAVRECTGTVTLLRHGPRVQYRAQYTSGVLQEFGDNCPDRDNEFSDAMKEAKRKSSECDNLADTLPREILSVANAIRAHEETFERLRAESKECKLAVARVEEEISEAENAFDEFTERLRKTGTEIPWFYRNLAHWWSPWIWLPRLFASPFAPPAWTVFLQDVRAHDLDRRALKKLKSKGNNVQGQSDQAQKTVEVQAQTLVEARSKLVALQQQHKDLPSTKEKLAARQRQIAVEREDHARQRLARFHEEIRQLTDMQLRGSDVTQLDLTYPARLLPAGLVVIDTPGVNTDSAQNRGRAWEIIRREADGCIVLTDIQQAVSASTREFISEVRKVVPHLILVLTKVDRALNAAEIGDGSAEEQIEEARRTGEKRFAKAVGRDPREILTFAIAAERALCNDDANAVARFAADVQRLVAVLKHEKILIVAARCATAIRECSAGITEAQTRAENEYRERIASLEAQQITHPDPFCAEQLSLLESGILQAVRSATDCGRHELYNGMKVLAEKAVDMVLQCSDADALKKIGGPIEAMLIQLRKNVDRAVMGEAGRHAKFLDGQALEALKERYRIVQNLAGRAGRDVGDRQLVEYSVGSTGLEGNLQNSVSQYNFNKGVGLVGGAATGAIVGSFVPVIGTVVGALVGGVLGALFGPNFDKVKRDRAGQVVNALQEQQESIDAQLNESAEGLANAIHKSLAASLKAEVKRFRSWIGEVIEEENRKLSRERAQLNHLVGIRKALQANDARLQELMHQAAKESAGICRDVRGG